MATTSSTTAASNLTTSATTHLRKAFKYRTDDDTTMDDRDELDEEEQETLIADLHSSNATTNLFYVRVFTALPLLAMLPFSYYLTLGATRVAFLPCVLAVTSLAASAFTMGFVPHSDSTGASGAEAAAAGEGDDDGEGWVGGGKRAPYGTVMTKGAGLSDIAHAQASRRRAALAVRGDLLGVELPFVVPVDVQGPVSRWIQILNGGLSAVLAVFAVLLIESDAVGAGFWLLLLLPGVLCAVVAVVRSAMRETERGLKDLGRLRYDYKGA